MPELNQLKNHKPEVKLQIEGGPVALQNAKNQYTRWFPEFLKFHGKYLNWLEPKVE